MPRISAFYGIVITMYFRDHNPPHFHVTCGEFKAQIVIENRRNPKWRDAGKSTKDGPGMGRSTPSGAGSQLAECKTAQSSRYDRSIAMKVRSKVLQIESVEPLEGFKLRLGFSDGSTRIVDLESELWGPVFELLKNDPELFRQVRVDPELGTIVWPNGADLDPDVLHGDHAPA